MDDELRRHARSFGSVADSYDRGRPSFPAEAAAWLVGQESATVLELGAGTGKLTELLVAAGHDVHATEPDADMLAILQRRLPDVPTSQSGAEEIPLPDGSIDVVVVAQAFHWFDHETALPEIARVLRPGGHLALAWNVRDERIPWVRKLSRIIGSQEAGSESAEPLVLSEHFGFVEEATFSHWQDINRESIVDLVVSRSNVAVLDHDAREEIVDQVLDLYNDYGRGMDGMQLPYDCRCYKAVAAPRASSSTTEADETEIGEPAAGSPGSPGSPDATSTGPSSGPSDGGDTETLLIDFR